MTQHIVYTRFDGGVNICHPAEECLSAMSSGGYWSDRPRGFLEEQIERQIAAGHKPDAAHRFAHALQFGGCVRAEALEIIRDRDCGHLGTAHELYQFADIPQDRWFRDAWRRSHNGGPIYIELTAARRIQFRKIRQAATAENKRRQDELDRFDMPVELELGALRDKIYSCDDPSALRRVWPEELNFVGI